MLAVREALHQAAADQNLTEEQATAAMVEILDGKSTAALTGALLTALRMKGETAPEVTGFARAMRMHAIRVKPTATPPEQLADTCGTGGDGGTTFNISTTSAIVAAGAGLAIAKHGNRSISSRCGSADVLEALGVAVGLGAEQVAQSIDATGIGFLFAPGLHPAMRHAAPVRRELGMRTAFNLLGPLTNPADAATQVVGVYDRSVVLLAAEALLRLGCRRALVVHGGDGIDEITLTGPTYFAHIRQGAIQEGVLVPADFGLEVAGMNETAGGDASANAAVIRDVLAGTKGAARDVVLLNAGAILHIAGIAADWQDGARLAAESIDSGAARRKLAELARFTARCAQPG